MIFIQDINVPSQIITFIFFISFDTENCRVTIIIIASLFDTMKQYFDDIIRVI